MPRHDPKSPTVTTRANSYSPMIYCIQTITDPGEEPLQGTTRKLYESKLISAEEAVGAIQPSDVVLWACLAEPTGLTGEFVRQKERLRGLRMVLDLSLYPHPWFEPGFDAFTIYENYPGAFTRKPVAEGRIEFVPWPFGLGRTDRAQDSNRQHFFSAPDVYLTEVTPPDAEGYVSFGNYPWFAEVAAANARVVIGEVNPNLLRTTARAHISEITYFVQAPPKPAMEKGALPPAPQEDLDIAQVIGAQCADLIRDGDTVQMGIGGGSEWTQDFLGEKNDLGIHSEFISVKVVQLVKQGVITGAKKTVNHGVCVSAGLGIRPEFPGVDEAIEYVTEHPEKFAFRGLSYVSNAKVVADHDNFTAINSALACDLTGQLVVNYLGNHPISGIGGNLDFTIGAHYSKNGRAVHCLMSTAKGGTRSRIIPQHPEGAIIAIPRTYVDYLVTEHGVVNLEGKSVRERADLIISLAHPDFREELRSAGKKLGLL
jgi:4-hydroxybutyrate CoA-transferase